MDRKGLQECLTLMKQMREERLKAAAMLRKDPGGIPLLLEFIFDDEEEYGFRGGWALDLALQEDLHLILPHLDQFMEGLPKLTHESAIRPMAKICEMLSIAYFRAQDEGVRSHLTSEHREVMAERCFDWLIGNHKVAAKAYSMTALYELGKEIDWVHPELELVLERNYKDGSSGYQARARKILDRLRKKRGIV